MNRRLVYGIIVVATLLAFSPMSPLFWKLSNLYYEPKKQEASIEHDFNRVRPHRLLPAYGLHHASNQSFRHAGRSSPHQERFRLRQNPPDRPRDSHQSTV